MRPEKARALVKQGTHSAHERQQIKQRNFEALEECKRARESSFAKVAKAYLAEIKPSVPIARKSDHVTNSTGRCTDECAGGGFSPFWLRPLLLWGCSLAVFPRKGR